MFYFYNFIILMFLSPAVGLMRGISSGDFVCFSSTLLGKPKLIQVEVTKITSVIVYEYRIIKVDFFSPRGSFFRILFCIPPTAPEKLVFVLNRINDPYLN